MIDRKFGKNLIWAIIPGILVLLVISGAGRRGEVLFSAETNEYKTAKLDCQGTGKIWLESISFNHDPDCEMFDGINIRKNQDEDIRIPEWKNGELSYPAVYIKNRHIIIKAVFAASTGVKTARISAVRQAGYFGDLKEELVYFDKSGLSGVICLEIPGKTPPKIKAYCQEWEWYCRDINGRGSSKIKIGNSKNRIYILLEEPKSPWEPNGNNIPWSDVLDYSCKWANGESDTLEAAAQITRHLYSDIGGYYAYSSYYTNNSESPFDLKNFLERIPSMYGVEEVNCFDMAKAIVSFSNVLGCDMSYKICEDFGDYLDCIKPIGYEKDCCESFKPHTFGCINGRVFDATLKSYEYDREEWIANTAMGDYKRKVIKEGYFGTLRSHQFEIKSKNRNKNTFFPQRFNEGENYITGIEVEIDIFSDIVHSEGSPCASYRIMKDYNGSYSSVIHNIWDTEIGKLDIRMIVSSAVQGIEDVDSSYCQEDGSECYLEQHNVILWIRANRGLRDYLSDISARLYNVLLKQSPVSSYSKLKGIPEICRFSLETRTIKLGKKARIYLEVKNPAGGECHYFWRTYGGHIEKDKKNIFFYQGDVVGIHPIEMIVINELGLLAIGKSTIEVIY